MDEAIRIDEVKTNVANLTPDAAQKYLKALYTSLQSISFSDNALAIANLLIEQVPSFAETALQDAIRAGAPQEKILSLAKKNVDYHFDSGFHYLLQTLIKEDKYNVYSQIKPYIIAKIESMNEKEIRSLETKIALLKLVAGAEKIIAAETRLYSMVMSALQEGTEDIYIGCRILLSLQKYDTAAEICMQYPQDEGFLSTSQSIRFAAKNHLSAENKDKIAKTIFDSEVRTNDIGNEIALYQCAHHLGKLNELQKTITKRISTILPKNSLFKKPGNPSQPPRFFRGILVVMHKLGGFDSEINELCNKYARYLKEQGSGDDHKDMAFILHEIEKKESAMDYFLILLDKYKSGHPSNTLMLIQEIEDLYGEKAELDTYKLQALERSNEYAKAAIVADRLGLTQKAAALRALVGVVKCS